MATSMGGPDRYLRVPDDRPAIGGLTPSPPPLRLDPPVWRSASAYPGATGYPFPVTGQPRPLDVDVRPERARLILPSQVAEQLAAERAAELHAQLYPAPSHRSLTDEECVERWGDTRAGLRESMRYWETRVERLPWWRRRARREARQARAQATAICAAVEIARVRISTGQIDLVTGTTTAYRPLGG